MNIMKIMQPATGKLAVPLALAFALGLGHTQAAEKKAPTIRVAKTEASSIASWQPAMGEGLAQMLITELSGLPNFKVLESVALNDLREEREVGESGEVSAKESVKKGQWKGADYTFKSTVTRFGSKEQDFGGHGFRIPVPFMPGGGGFSVKKTENEVQIDWRIVDNANREVVVTGRGDGIEKGTGFNFGSWAGGGFQNNREFMDSALGKATMKAIAEIMAKVKTLDLNPGARTVNNDNDIAVSAAALRNVKGIVQLVDGKEVWVSLGANHGFAKGDSVKIYKPIAKKNKKGQVIATTYELVAEIALVKVQKDKSMGRYEGSVPIGEDYAAADASVDIEKLD
jgi:curli biogenesis system outer membrane secretion channel CsgG